MSMDLTQLNESQSTVRIFCVIPEDKTEESVSKYLHTAYQRCIDNIKTETQWIAESEVLKLSPGKSDVFILDPLKGPVCSHLEKFKCTIIGPMCLLSSIERCQAIPPSKGPLANLALHNLVVTLSGFDKKTKENLSRKIEMMAGHYSPHFVESVTHLVTDEALSNKYNVAVERETPIMTADWIDAVWAANKVADVPAVDSRFSEFVAPPFIGLKVTLSKFDTGEVADLKRIIEENGGSFLGRLQNNYTKVLVLSDPTGDKYNYAQKWRIPCVNADWIHDSVHAHHALPVQQYAKWKTKAVKVNSSTPTRDGDDSFKIPDISAIMSNTSRVAESFLAEPSQTFQASTQSKPKAAESSPESVKALETVDALDIVQIRKYGTFLDGSKIFCSGFNESHMEKLRRICVNAGANHYWNLSDVVTHVIAGNKVEEHLKLIESFDHRPHIVSPDWLVASSKLKQQANEKDFLMFRDPEPMVSDQSLARNRRNENGANDILRYYVTAGSQQNVTEVHLPAEVQRSANISLHRDESSQPSLPPPPEASVHELEEQPMEVAAEDGELFKDLRFVVIIDGDEGETVTRCINENGGVIVTEDQERDYIVTAFGIDQEVSRAITSSWILDCVDENKLLEVSKLYRPFVADFSVKPLDGCVTVFSGYRQTERAYLEAVAIALGAYVEDKFSRRDVPDKNVRGATHLLCNQPIGDKYAAALKWNVCAVTGKWLLSSLKLRKRVDEAEFLTKNALEDDDPFDIMDSPKPPTPQPVRPARHLQGISSMQTPDRLEPPIGHGITLTPDSPLSREEQFRRENPAFCFRRQLMMKHAEKFEKVRPSAHESTAFKGAQPEHSQPLVGMNIFLSGRLADSSPELLRQIRLLGGNVRYHLDKTVTHVIHQGRIATKEVKQAKEWNIPVLAPIWIEECMSTNSKVDEQLFPHTYNPNMSLQVSSQSGGSDNPKRARMDFSESQVKVSKEKENASPTTSNGSVNEGRTSKLDTHLDALAQMLAESAQKRLELEAALPRPGSGISSLPPPPPRVVEETQDPQIEVQQDKAESQIVESQSTAFTWVDPQEKALQELLAERERNGGKPPVKSVEAEAQTADLSSELEKSNGRRNSDEPSILRRSKPDLNTSPCRFTVIPVVDTPSMKRSVMKRKPVVMFSMMDQRAREDCGELIRELGGKVIDASNFCPEVTHIVIPCPMRNEKLLASLAGGRWVIHPAWLDACERAGKFVPEDQFEWGRPGCEFTARLPYKSSEHRLALAAHRWRCRMDSTFNEAGAFRDFRVILHTAEIRCGAFQRLIEAGGGVVRNIEPPYTEPRDVNYVIAELEKCTKDIDLLSLAKRGIPVVLPLFLNEFLTSDATPDFEPFFPEPFRNFKSIFKDAHDQLAE